MRLAWRHQMLQLTALNLNEMVGDLEPLLRRAAGAAVALEIRLAPCPATVVTDRGCLEQVVLTLARAAREAMPQGGVLMIAVGRASGAGPADPPSGPTDPPDVDATLTVTATGAGMNDVGACRIFAPSGAPGGSADTTGVGLSEAYDVLRQGGGRVVVQSVGGGTSVTISLPWRAPGAPEPASHAAPRVLVGGAETILVVDDNLEIREVVRRVLSIAGYHVLPSASGEDALEILQQRDGRVDLLLTDVVMPGMSGVDLAALVHVQFPAVRVLLTSGNTDEALVAHGAQERIGFLGKPYSLKALTQKVRQVLDVAT